MTVATEREHPKREHPKREHLERVCPESRADTYKPNAGMKTAAQRALDWKEQGKKGMTEVGIKRAKDIVADKAFALSDVKDINSYFARHESDKKATGFKEGEEGYPTPGRVSWDGWGGDPGQKWSKDIVEKSREEKEQPDRLPEPPNRGLSVEFDLRDVEIREPEDGDDEADGSSEFEGYAIRWNEETEIHSWFFSFTERFRRGAFKKTIAERGPNGNRQIKFLRQHNSRQSVAAKVLELREDSTGLFFRARTIATAVGKDLAIELREGVVDTLSVGFDAILEEYDKEKNLRTVIEARLFEISAVLWPAYAGATVEAVRSEQLTREIHAFPAFLKELESRVEEGLSEESVAALRSARDSLGRIVGEVDDSRNSEESNEPCAGDGSGDGSEGESQPPGRAHPDASERDATLSEELDLALELREREMSL